MVKLFRLVHCLEQKKKIQKIVFVVHYGSVQANLITEPDRTGVEWSHAPKHFAPPMQWNKKW